MAFKHEHMTIKVYLEPFKKAYFNGSIQQTLPTADTVTTCPLLLYSIIHKKYKGRQLLCYSSLTNKQIEYFNIFLSKKLLGSDKMVLVVDHAQNKPFLETSREKNFWKIRTKEFWTRDSNVNWNKSFDFRDFSWYNLSNAYNVTSVNAKQMTK